MDKARPRTPPHELVAPMIDKARKLIEQCGWTRGSLCTDEGYCIIGALLAAEKDEEVQELGFDVLRRETGARTVSAWNDLEAKDKKEVLKILARAASRARTSTLGVPRMAGRCSIFSFV